MAPRAKRKGAGFYKGGGGLKGGTYTCQGCGKLTRDTGNDEAGCMLCVRCYEESGRENAHADGHHEETPDGECKACRVRVSVVTVSPTSAMKMVTPKDCDPVARVAEAMLMLERTAHAVRKTSHAGPCPACDGGEVWTTSPHPDANDTDEKERVLGNCPVCHGHAVLDCDVLNCGSCR